MHIPIWLQGILIGISIAAPVGPIGILCIRRTLAGGRSIGLATGLGAATADALYASVAGFGLAAISDILLRYQSPLRTVGGGFLCYLGLRTFLARPASEPAVSAQRGLLSAFASTFLLTITNPITILAFAGIFAGLGVVQVANDYGPAAELVAGVFSGSALWWLTLSAGTSLLRRRLDHIALLWINRIAGLLIAGFGLAILISLLGANPSRLASTPRI